MAVVYLVQHAERQSEPGDPELTELGREQASRTAEMLSHHGVRAVFSSPLRRALQTARPIADALGVEVVEDRRLAERMNWDGRQPLAEFLADWDRATRVRDFAPRTGDSSHRAAARLIAFVQSVVDMPGPVVAVSHGGVTTDMLRTLLGDDQVPRVLLEQGVPSCAITTLEGSRVLRVAAVDHF
ncbi:broad specificity phosphatase PhoE [Hamadaea flava]|uniref:Histidine phosphatase family protein n=1 Tax=Hamadaea flava TaxID=1742688 RepID=A0ABV8M0A5_9ACTN|nr:histidine phosphatase family protein [Hamadaea flava]MCP2326898.1 broad specificity phosphatase PhoE [Hamadaea flava]